MGSFCSTQSLIPPRRRNAGRGKGHVLDTERVVRVFSKTHSFQHFFQVASAGNSDHPVVAQNQVRAKRT